MTVIERPAAAVAAGLTLALLGAAEALAQTIATAPPAADVEQLVVIGRRLNLVGEAISASEGQVGRGEIGARPLVRSGDLLEFVPGLVATQHSGSGKANQYFLRGFNLDHGTDFATFVDAMPFNMRTHGHGQGWTDLNPLIPEAVETLSYRKGVYYADVGDFSSAGSARFALADTVPQGVAEVTAGSFGYLRGVVVGSTTMGGPGGALLYGLEAQAFDGPWDDIDEDVQKLNGLLRYSADVGGGRASVTLMAYDNAWNSHDQIPQRAVDSGLISDLGSLDPTVGGESSRYSLSGAWRGPALGGRLEAEAYAVDSSLDLFSNFTYFLDDPVNGDQFEQVDERRLYGFALSQTFEAGRSRWRFGADGRFDDIERVGLYRTQARERLSTVREDAVQEGSFAVYAANELRFSDALRSYVGVRHDRYGFDVDARSLPANSGEAEDDVTSLKASLIYRPRDAFELYASAGQGFHSNDARGTTIRFDPVSGDPADPVDPLVRSEGGEFGARVYFNDRLHATAAAWTLRLDSELLFVGDAGATEASRPSRRDGVELGLYYFAGDRFSADAELSYTRSRFRDDDPAGDVIPGGIPLVLSTGATANLDDGYTAALRLRYFGQYPLIEDESVESDGSLIVNLRGGKTWAGAGVGLFVDVLNVLDSDDHDIDYFYASRLQGEPDEGVEDRHFNVFQPRAVRVSLRRAF